MPDTAQNKKFSLFDIKVTYYTVVAGHFNSPGHPGLFRIAVLEGFDERRHWIKQLRFVHPEQARCHKILGTPGTPGPQSTGKIGTLSGD